MSEPRSVGGCVGCRSWRLRSLQSDISCTVGCGTLCKRRWWWSRICRSADLPICDLAAASFFAKKLLGPSAAPVGARCGAERSSGARWRARHPPWACTRSDARRRASAHSPRPVGARSREQARMGRVMIQRGARLNADGKPLRTSAPTSAAPRRRQSGAPKHSALLLRHPGAGPGGQATARAGGRVASGPPCSPESRAGLAVALPPPCTVASSSTCSPPQERPESENAPPFLFFCPWHPHAATHCPGAGAAVQQRAAQRVYAHAAVPRVGRGAGVVSHCSRTAALSLWGSSRMRLPTSVRPQPPPRASLALPRGIRLRSTCAPTSHLSVWAWGGCGVGGGCSRGRSLCRWQRPAGHRESSRQECSPQRAAPAGRSGG